MLVADSITLATRRVVAPIQGMHRAISARWFGAAGQAATPARRAHDAVSDVVYGSIRVGGAIAGHILGSRMSDASAASESVQSVVNGLWGDALGRYGSQLEIPMSVRDRSGAPVVLPTDLERPSRTRRATSWSWFMASSRPSDAGKVPKKRPGWWRRSEAHPLLTPVAIRYNSGLRVSDNGVAWQTCSMRSTLSGRCPWSPFPWLAIRWVAW